MKYSDNVNLEIARQEYENNKIGFKLDIDENYIGTLSDINDNRTNNGEQIFTYTKISHGSDAVTPNASLSERQKVEEITILYQGSTSPLNFKAKEGEVGRDWVDNDLEMAKRTLSGDKNATGQLEASSEYLKEMMEKYPNAKVNIYTHSLGSMDAQFALANVTDYSRINYVYLSNGPNIYPILSYDQRVNASMLYDKIHNYIDSRDPIGFGYEEGKGAVGKVYKFTGVDKISEVTGISAITGAQIGGTIAGPIGALVGGGAGAIGGYIYSAGTDQHLWGGYRFDSDGNLIDEYGMRVKPWDKLKETERLQVEAGNIIRAAAISKIQGFSVDVDRDGKLDAQFGKDKLFTTELMPGSGAGKDIVINFSSLQGLSKNLQGLLEDIKQIRDLLNKSASINSTVESRKSSRTETLEQSIISYLEQINLIKSIRNLDNFYTKLESKKKLFSVVGNYSASQFSRQFTWTSGLKKWCYRSGASWNHDTVTRLLETLSGKAKETSDSVSRTVDATGGTSYPKRNMVTINTRSQIAQKGKDTINSFKRSIDDALKGEGIRSAFDDGIANPLSDVLKVEQTNIDKMEECINSMIGSVNALAESHRNNDTTIEQNWRSNQDVMGGYEVGSIPTDFDTFVKQSDLFDDLEVLKAFDQQVDNTTKSLGDSMITSFSEYLSEAKSSARGTHVCLKDTEYAANDVISEFPTEICYKEKEDDIHFYNTVEACISIASSIKEIKNFINDIEGEYQETIRTIDNAGGTLPTLKSQLRSYLEDAIYNYSTLSDVVKAQRVIAGIMKRLCDQVQSYLSLVNENKGKSIEALAERMGEMGTMASHISQIVEQCFGSKA